MVNPRPIVIVVTSTMLWAQDAVLEQITGDAISTPDLDRIEFYSDNPILLDSARVEDILQLPLVSRTTARRIVSLLRTKKPRTLAELCDAVRCSQEERYILERCATLGGTPLVSIPLSFRSRAMLWATPPRAATDGRFRGSPHELYTRVHMVHGNTAVAALANKDAGEPLVADFLSASIATRVSNISIIIGDYYAEMGLGLVLWRPFGARKGTDVVTPCTEFGRGFQQYRSALEYRFFRGVALEYPIAVADGTTMLVRAGLSALPRSASLDTVGAVITSLATDGYHRSSSEIARRRNVTERAALGALELRTGQFVAGFSTVMLEYPMPVTSSSTLVMPARRGLFASAYALQNTDNATWSAELARDYAGNVATRAGLEYRTTPTTVTLGARWYAPMFRAPYGYNFGESSQPTNETGIYLGIRARLASKVENLFYADVYRHTAGISTLPRLRRGVDIFNETRVRLGKGTVVFVRLRQEHRTEDRSTDAGTVAEEVLRSTLRCEVLHRTDGGTIARFRIEGVWRIPTESALPTVEHGLAAFGELSMALSAQFRLGGRVTAYSTASFNSVVYTFEQLAPGLLVSVPLYGRGTRWFVYVQWSAFERITVWVRYGSTERLNTTSLGSGLTAVPGTLDQRAYVQLDVRL